MADLATLTAQLEALRKAYRSGVPSVSYESKNATYRDAAGMRESIAALESEIAAATGAQPVRVAVIRSSKGW